MRVLLRALPLLLCTLSWCEESVNAPRVQFDAEAVTLPDHLWSVSLTHTFTFRNTGTKGLTVTVEKTSCGCTAAVVSDTIVPPGGTGSIDMVYTPNPKDKLIGVRAVSANLKTNDPLRAEVYLEMKLRLTETVAATPETLEFDGNSPKPVPLTVTCYHRGASRKVLSIDPSVKGISVRPLDIEEVAGELTRYHYEVIFAAAGERRPQRAALIVRTDSPELPVLEIPVKAALDGADVRATPSKLLFGAVRPGTSPLKTATLESMDTHRIPARAACADPRVEATLVAPRGASPFMLHARVFPSDSQQSVERLKTTIDVLDETGVPLVAVEVFALLMPPEPEKEK